MKGIIDYFSVSSEYGDVAEIAFTTGAFFLYGANFEERSVISSGLTSSQPHVNFILIEELDSQQIKLTIKSTAHVYNLRSNEHVNNFKDVLENADVYIDITGLTHGTWAWLVRAMIARTSGNLWAVYSEPVEYKFHESPFDGQFFDLSEKIAGIEPLPGLARLTRFTSDNSLFMPLLGFEGARLAHIMEDVQPDRELTFPVIGVPGFRYDFPFYAYLGNKLTLEREGIWRNRRYEKANCPASIYVLGKALLERYNGKILRIAPIGTKPHALGAVLLKLARPNEVDIIYDHPVRKKGRTKGKSKTLCYWLQPFKQVIKN